MGRAPCCEKMGLKKGPWSQEEDQVLTSYIKIHGHGNWRALPKQAGLLRCGKSCRLRWINYLRPDIKRGNFTREEEDTIIKLHEMVGNRWSAIAARLPGRTDNEIKNVWHTHLKKRLKQKDQPVNINNNDVIITDGDHDHDDQYRQAQSPAPPPQESTTTTTTTTTTSSDMSSVTCSATAATTTNTSMEKEPTSSEDEVVEIDENFWTEVLSADNSTNVVIDDDGEQQRNDFNEFSSASAAVHDVGADVATPELGFGFTSSCSSSSHLYGNMDFWYNLFTAAGDSQEVLAQF